MARRDSGVGWCLGAPLRSLVRKALSRLPGAAGVTRLWAEVNPDNAVPVQSHQGNGQGSAVEGPARWLCTRLGGGRSEGDCVDAGSSWHREPDCAFSDGRAVVIQHVDHQSPAAGVARRVHQPRSVVPSVRRRSACKHPEVVQLRDVLPSSSRRTPFPVVGGAAARGCCSRARSRGE